MEPTNSTPASAPTSAPAPAPASAPTPIAENNESNNNQSWKIATAIAAIVAICGIGFGVYGMMQGSQTNDQISNLKAQIAQKDKTIASLESELAEKETTIDIDLNGEVKLTDTEAKNLIETKRQQLGYDTWTTGTVKVTKKGDNNYYWVIYEENSNDGYTNELNVIFHYENGEWVFNLPGFSGYTEETIEQYNFQNL